MKKLTILAILLSLGLTNCTNAAPPKEEKQKEEQPMNYPFKMYPTENVWTFIKLDTRSGKMWQVQYSVKGDEYRFEEPLNTNILSSDSTAGRFELYPTQNMYNFMLLDRINGSTWQVQWSQDLENRGIVPIKQSAF